MVMLVQILFLVQLAGFTGNITALTVTVQGDGENLTTEAEAVSDESERTDTSSANDSLKYSSPTPSSNWRTDSDPEQDIGPDSSGELSDDEVDGESAFEPETESERTDTSSANDSLKYSSPTPSSNWRTDSDPEQDIGPDSSGELSDDEVDGESAFEPETETSVNSNEELGNDKHRQRLLVVAGVLLPVVVILLIAVVLLMKKFKVVNQKGTYTPTAVSPE
ncbi:clumping factor A-like isoform X2 [Heterodontus francisci]|uniref:clumping factor A-like isoform X2 n=1 Tax=Heterodontus francisci TaxID=7792 RepID=UPI00355AEB82